MMFNHDQDLDKIVETIEKHCKDVFEEIGSEMSFEVSSFCGDLMGIPLSARVAPRSMSRIERDGGWSTQRMRTSKR